MIYLTFDSNIWIYLLDDSWKEYNPLDYLEHWIEEKHIKILLPRIILNEWDKHREIEKEKRKTILKDLFFMIEEIIPAAFIEDHKKPENINDIIETQFNRIENLIKSEAEIIELTPETKSKLIDWGIDKKAPMHKKSSIADAIIILSLFEFAEKNPNDSYVFISGNKEDFYTKNDKGKHFIHNHLKAEFDKAKIKDFTDIKSALKDLKERLPVTIDIEAYKKDRIRYKIKEKVYNPVLVKSLDNIQDTYLDNTQHLDLILKSSNPTKQQVLFALGLIDSGESYKQYFYRKVDIPAWFFVLKEKGVFEYTNNPDLIQVEKGFQIPLWEPLIYLEKISLKIKEGKEIELTSEVVSIIKSISENPVDNYRTWYSFIRMLENFPNERIPKEILHFIPVWLKSRFDTTLQSSEICERLLPKFLSTDATKDDIEKAEIILQHLFEIEKTEIANENVWDVEGSTFRSRVHLHFLSATLVERKLVSKIVNLCSNQVILNLGKTIKKLLLDYPNGIQAVLKDGEKEYEIKTRIEDKSLLISSRPKGGEIFSTSTLTNFEELDSGQLKQKFIEIIGSHGIKYVPNESVGDAFQRINFHVTNDLFSSYGHNTIQKLGDKFQYGEKVLDVFALIFRDLLDEKAKQNSVEVIELLKTICEDKNYYLPFYKRIALYVVSENWNETKSVFWELISDNDHENLFSKHKYGKELYELLNRNQHSLNEKEKNMIKNIIDIGPQAEKDGQDERYFHYWQLKWYAALKDTEPFKEKYLELSKLISLTNEHYENLGEMKFKIGSTSPFSLEEILLKKNEEIVNYINSFKPKDRWEEPTIEGLSEALGKAVEAEPQRFSNEVNLYNDVYYIYAYQIINGFKEAWKNKRLFNWQNVLEFCKSYILNEKFYSGKFYLANDGWNANADWVVGAIANLLTEGMQNDKKAFNTELLPIAKEILKILVINLKEEKNFKETNMDYPTYSLNSTAGKVLRALIDYSLMVARNSFELDDTKKWELELKELFEKTLTDKVIDGYILEGMYFDQFYYLDKEWISEQVKINSQLEDREWFPFIGGFAFHRPPFNRDIYQLLYPHYERAIDNNIELKSFYNQGLIRHLVAFYFWSYEDLKKEGLVLKFLNKAETSSILEFLNFVCRQENYTKSLDDNERRRFEKIILELWNYLIKKFEEPKNEEEKRVLGELSSLTVFFSVLNEENTNLILKSSKYIGYYYNNFHDLIETLSLIKEQGEKLNTAKYIGQILFSVNFGDYFSDSDNNNIIELVIFLYQNEQKKAANDFCNKLSANQHEFLREVYNKYNQ